MARCVREESETRLCQSQAAVVKQGLKCGYFYDKSQCRVPDLSDWTVSLDRIQASGSPHIGALITIVTIIIIITIIRRGFWGP